MARRRRENEALVEANRLAHEQLYFPPPRPEEPEPEDHEAECVQQDPEPSPQEG